MIVNLPYHNLTVIDFNNLFVEEYQLNILDHLHKFNLLGKPLTNPDVKKIFYHNLIYSICKVLTKEYNSLTGENEKDFSIETFKKNQLTDFQIKHFH